jgi:hypothetical protein
VTDVGDIAPLGEAWQLGTYRRMDALKVPAFSGVDISGLVPERRTRAARLYRLPTALPRELLPLADWLNGVPSPRLPELSDIERLSLLFRYLSSPLRYEPHNIYQVHRAVPSARCIYPIDLLLAQTGRDGKRRTYLYHPAFHGLEPLCEDVAARDEGGDGPGSVIAGVGRFWKIVRKYGDFTPFPVMLEAGMMISQLRFLRRAVGWTGESTDPEPGRAFCNGDLEFPIFAETIDRSGFDITGLPARDVVLATQAEMAGSGQGFDRLAYLMRLFDTPAGPAPATPGDPADRLDPGSLPASLGLLETMRLRHSANDRVGMAPIMAGEEGLLERFAKLAMQFRHNRESLPGEQRLHVALVWPGRAAPEAGVYDRGAGLLARVDRRRMAQVMEGALPTPDLRYNLPAHSLLVLIVADPHAHGMQEDAAFRDSHVAAGALAQDYCLAAAALGQFARPVRMLREQVLESAFPLGGQIIYTLLCGTGRATNIMAELL